MPGVPKGSVGTDSRCLVPANRALPEYGRARCILTFAAYSFLPLAEELVVLEKLASSCKTDKYRAHSESGNGMQQNSPADGHPC